MKPVIQVVHDRQALEAIVPAWEELAAHACESNPFYEPWMLLPALRAQGEGEGFLCALVWDEERLVGLFPFRRIPRFKHLPAPTLTSWRHSAYLLCTPLVHASSAVECLRAVLYWATANASLLELRYVPRDGAFDAALEEALIGADCRVLPVAQFDRALLCKAASAEAYMESAMSGQLRRHLRRSEKKLREAHGVRYISIRPGDAIGDEIDTFLALEASGWKGQAGGALAASEETLRFGREILEEAHRRGRLHMVGIDCDARPVARRCSLLAGEGAYAFRTAYDEDFASYSPGVLAEAHSLREFHRLPGVQWMDSYTDPDNVTVNRMWKDRRPMQTLAVGLGAWGNFWLGIYSRLRSSISSARQNLSISR
jgi:CelD/BcsL family acetyltransferase involved in cellulose biosynthesis